MLKRALLVLLLGTFSLTRAATTYYYSGNNFSDVYGSWGVTTADSMTASLTFASPLPADLFWVTVFPVSWTISDGIHTLTSYSGAESVGNPAVSTDASGTIYQWALYTWQAPGADGISPELATRYNGITGFDRTRGWKSWDNVGGGFNVAPDYTAPGAWTPGSAGNVPEPSTLAIAVSGVALIGALRRHPATS